ncbi:MAG TPA: hypothetical protein VM032_08765 [Vicinamibacterales bacterium]|nr:hypothetical protein [Vicinamibacterales bacterium]
MPLFFDKATALNRNIARLDPPSITGATRLETLPTSVGLLSGLKAPLADPLWLLSRQWQFNEFQGEDAGTPLKIAFAVRGTQVDAFRSGSDAQDRPWQPLAAGTAPIETRVEAEPVWRTHPRLRGEAGLHALRMAAAPLRAALLRAYPLTLDPPAGLEADADQAGLLWSALFNRRTIDASALADDLAPLLDAAGTLTGLPAALVLDGGDAAPAGDVLGRWMAWFRTLAYEGDEADRSWQRNRMEYAFALKAGDLALEADEYTDGHVDWDDFRVRTLADQDAAAPRTFAVQSRHPSPVMYPGMPSQRYWEFEDGHVNFAGAEAGITDFLRMSVTEFALTFGNDWFVVPVRLPVGWLYQVASFTITDSFGTVASPQAIRNPDGTRWTLYELTTEGAAQGRLAHAVLLPDSVVNVQEGAVLEETLLARDEMANLAWAIERRVQGVSGEPLDREFEARSLAFQQQIHFDTAPASPQVVYRLATPVPANWTPLLPVRDPELDLADPLTIRLARAGMKRFYPEASVEVLGPAAGDADYRRFLDNLDAQTTYVTRVTVSDALRAYVFYPRGWLLRTDPTRPMGNDPLLLEEEEVPRIGARLKRKFQYARSSDGRSWLWIGRNKIAGSGEAASELRFDSSVKTTTLR